MAGPDRQPPQGRRAHLPGHDHLPLRDGSGRITHYVAVKRDVTEQEKAEAALRASEARYRAIVEDQMEFISASRPTSPSPSSTGPTPPSRAPPEELVGTSLQPDERESRRGSGPAGGADARGADVSYEMDTVLPTGPRAGSTGPTGRCSTRRAGWSSTSRWGATSPRRGARGGPARERGALPRRWWKARASSSSGCGPTAP